MAFGANVVGEQDGFNFKMDYQGAVHRRFRLLVPRSPPVRRGGTPRPVQSMGFSSSPAGFRSQCRVAERVPSGRRRTAVPSPSGFQGRDEFSDALLASREKRIDFAQLGAAAARPHAARERLPAPGRVSSSARLQLTNVVGLQKRRHVPLTCRWRRHNLTTCRKNVISETRKCLQRGGQISRTTIFQGSRRPQTWRRNPF